MTRKEALRFRSIVEQAVAFLDDKTASAASTLFPRLKQVDPGSSEEIPLVKAGTRISWNGTIKKATVDLWDTKENNPDNAPTQWADLDYKDGYRIIPEVITAGTAFAAGEYGWLGNTLYRSKVAANVYTPEQYPDNWEKINE